MVLYLPHSFCYLLLLLKLHKFCNLFLTYPSLLLSCTGLLQLLLLVGPPPSQPYSYSPALLLLSGLTPTLWSYSYSLVLLLLSGLTPTIWPYSYSLTLLLLSGLTPTIWPCSYSLSLLLRSGLTSTL